MTPAELTALTGGAGVVIGAVIGAASSWWTTAISARQAEKTRRAERREAAYTQFILSAETLHRVITASETLPDVQPSETVGSRVAQAAGSVSRTYIAIMLAGSTEAASIGADIDGKAREVSNWFTSTVSTLPLNAELVTELQTHLSAYTSLLGTFAEVARRELA